MSADHFTFTTFHVVLSPFLQDLVGWILIISLRYKPSAGKARRAHFLPFILVNEQRFTERVRLSRWQAML